MGFPADTNLTTMQKNGFKNFGEPEESRFGKVVSVAEGVASGDELSILLDEMLIFRKSGEHILNGTPEDLKAGILKIFREDIETAERFRIQQEFKEKGFIK